MNTLTVDLVDIDDLAYYAGNPRVGSVDAIAESLTVNGQYRPVVVNARTYEVLAGNHTLRAARKLGWTQIAATFVDVDDEQAARIVLIDNRSNDLAGYDDASLVELLRSLDELTGTGYSHEDLVELEAGLGTDDEPVALTDPDYIPPEPAEPHTAAGQTWLLGAHRLAIGDSGDPGVLADALGDAGQASMVLTDPPYNVAYEGRTDDAMRLENDDMTSAEFEDFMSRAYSAMYQVTIDGGPIYVFHADSETQAFRAKMTESGWTLRQCLIWIKHHFVMGRQDYHWQHEPILYGWKPGAAHQWHGGFTPTTVIDDQVDVDSLSKADLLAIVKQAFSETTVLRADRPMTNAEHPTMKPVALLAQLVENSSRAGATVLDPFGGSGSTLLACHRTCRRAALVEIDPRYADVICRRYQEHTDDKPVLEGTGERHDFLA